MSVAHFPRYWSRLATSLLELRLGDTPDLLAVAMACTTRASTAPARRAIAHLRTASTSFTVLLGGAAITDADQALRLGADGFSGRRDDDIARAIEELVATR